MSAERPPSAGNTDYKRWAERLNSYLVRTRSQLAYYVAGQTASEDGVLLWDADNSRLLVSSAGNWVPVAGSGGGGGTITNYLRDDADDSTNFRLTMAGLTVDTNTLYVDSTNNEVGIGTTNPSEKLEVVGNVEATEFIGDLRGAVVFKAQAGEALTKGDVVYISGISGQTTVVSKADANDAAKMPAFGLAAKDSSINTNLEVYTFGTLSGIDTSTFTEGDELFVGTTAGQLTDTPPTGESSSVQKIGKVTRSHASSGSIKIMGAGRTNATPNLNDGNIFIGDSNNQAVTTSLATQVSTLETSHSDVVVDGDFTSEGLMKRDATSGSYSIVTDNSSNWNTAHGWGNHASAGYLTAEANDLSTTVTWANVPDANITESSVTQHQAALTITESQISDLQSYLTSYTETNNLTTAVTWANVPDANITQSSVTQHQGALSITESQISDLGTYLTSSDISGKADTSGDTFTGDITIQGNSNNIIFDQNSTSAGAQEIRWENKTDGTRTGFIKGNYTYETSIGRSQVQLYLGTTPTSSSGDGITRLGILAGGDINFYSEDGSSASLRWDASEERLGLGTTTPSETLDVVGNIAVSGTVDGVDIATLNSNAIVDGDFTTAGIMTTDGNGVYSVDTNTYLTTHQDISGKADLSGATFTGNVAVGLPPSGTQSLTVAGATNLYGGADLQSTNITDVDTLTAKNVNITHTGNASVTTNIATGGGITGNTKVLNLGTGYGFGGTTTVNIGSSTPNSVNTINLNGNVSLGGTFNGHPEEMMRGIDVYHYYDDLSHQSGGNYYLNNTLTEYGNPFQFKTYTNGATRQLKISIEVSYFDVNSTNDCQIGLRVSPSSASALSMGSVISVTSPATYTRDIEVGGDYTKYLSKISAIANTSNGVQTLPIYKYYYNVFTSRTIIKVGVYGISAANIPSAGDTLYVHPFGWDASAQDIVRSIDAYNALGVVNNTVEQTFFLGTYTVRNSVRFIARETTTSENVSIDNLYGIFTDTGA